MKTKGLAGGQLQGLPHATQPVDTFPLERERHSLTTALQPHLFPSPRWQPTLAAPPPPLNPHGLKGVGWWESGKDRKNHNCMSLAQPALQHFPYRPCSISESNGLSWHLSKSVTSWISHLWVKNICLSLPKVKFKVRSSLMFWKNFKWNILLGFRAKRSVLLSQAKSSFILFTHSTHSDFKGCCGSSSLGLMLDGGVCVGHISMSALGDNTCEGSRIRERGADPCVEGAIATKASADRDLGELWSWNLCLQSCPTLRQGDRTIKPPPGCPGGGVSLREMALFHRTQFSERNPADVFNLSNHWETKGESGWYTRV